MNFTLYPYNMYILAAAAVAAVISLAAVGSTAVKTLKVLGSLPLDQTAKLTSELKEKSEVSGKAIRKASAGLRDILTAAILLKALKKYSDKEEHNSVKRVGKAASALMKDTRDSMKILNAVRRKKG